MIEVWKSRGDETRPASFVLRLSVDQKLHWSSNELGPEACRCGSETSYGVGTGAVKEKPIKGLLMLERAWYETVMRWSESESLRGKWKAGSKLVAGCCQLTYTSRNKKLEA